IFNAPVNTPVTFRIYGHSAPTAIVSAVNWRIDDLSLTATQTCYYVWAGTENTNWNNVNNWNFGSIPNGTAKISVPSTSNNPVIFQSSNAAFTEIGDINLAANTTLTVDGNNVGNVGAAFKGTVTGNGTISATSNATLPAAAKVSLSFEGAGTKNLSFTPGYASVENLAAWMPSGSTLEINSTMNLYGDLTWITSGGTVDFNGNAITLKSTATRTASVSEIQGTLNGATNVTVERYIPKNSSRAWRLLSVPTKSSGQSFKAAWQEGATAVGQNPVPNYGTIFTSGSTNWSGTGYDAQTPFGSLLSYDDLNPGWTEVSNTNNTLETTKGYFVYIRGDRTQTPSTSVSSITATTLRTTGALYTNDQPIITVPAGTFSLVGNVYPSAIDFTKINATSQIENTFWVWDPKLSLGGSLGAYQTFTGNVPFNFTPLYPGGSYGGSATTVIESGQAFFIKAQSGTEGTVQLKETSKTSSANGVFRPLSGVIPVLKTTLYGVNTNNSTYLADINYASFDAGYSNDVDGDDVSKLSNGNENIAIIRNNSYLIVEARQPFGAIGDTLFFYMWNMKQQQYRFDFAPQDMPVGATAVLVDRFTNTSTPISLMSPTSVTFTVNATAASYAAGRFIIVLKSSVVLPVTFTSINANKVNNGVQVSWNVTNELNIEKYEVERSINGINFATVGTVQATNNTGNAHQYQWLDAQPLQSVVYYRIKSVGTVGDVKYTAIVKVSVGQVKSGIIVLNNPLISRDLNIQFNNLAAGRYQIRLLNIVGQEYYKNVTEITGLSTIQNFTLPSHIVKGIYTLEVLDDNNQKIVQTIQINTIN
ncbi:MAG: hypothetical protein ACOYKE_10060, partial [Ferruginibacter sp.]